MMTFAGLFSFSRSAGAAVRDANGSLVTATINAPRFDHDLDGSRLGLLVDEGAEYGQQDRVTLKAAVAITGKATVFHALLTDDGSIARRAHFTLDATATINACLRQVGRHQSIGAVAGFVAIRDRYVGYRGKKWSPPAVIALADGTPITTADMAALLAG